MPWGFLDAKETLNAAAIRIARRVAGVAPTWMEQLGAFTEGSAHPAGATLTVSFVGALPFDSTQSWKPVNALTTLDARQRRILTEGVRAITMRLEQAPVAFALLPRAFTLAELQATYETILGRRLHKASFRRALEASSLVVPTGELRSEGRGRPAQLYRQATTRRKGHRRGIRFDLW